jgi:23S rRNA-/tRNA-specific pseudouridylate synthase/tRNA1(Val) A37 N6-methylase TrmN6
METSLTKNNACRLLKVLTVGDGDLSLSLALARAYGPQQISLTASTILSNTQELVQLYSNCSLTLKELAERNTHVRFNVDATQLHKIFSQAPFDLILFYNPHLGITIDAKDEAAHAKRHEVLLSHYLASASACLTPHGKVHLCLSGDQPQTWKVREAARRLGLRELQNGKPTNSAPWHSVMLLPHLNATEPEPGFAAPRKYRNNKHGSKHWLGKYGYCHRRTQGELYDGLSVDINVQGSQDFLFQSTKHLSSPFSNPMISECGIHTCPICLMDFVSEKAYHTHLDAPAMPCDKELVHHSGTIASPLKIQAAEDGNQGTIRLRKYVQKHYGKTQSAASQLIASGKVLVDGEVIKDRAYPLSSQFTVTVQSEDCEGFNDENPSLLTSNVDIVAQFGESIYIVWKPVGLRTKGHFPGTLESIFADQQGVPKIESVSRLDTGVSGLCLLHTGDSLPAQSTTRHRFIALVLGEVATLVGKKACSLVLHNERHRRWKKRKTISYEEKEEKSEYTVSLCVIETETLARQQVTLSTIQIDVSHDLSSIGSLLTYALRTQYQLAVVGDRFSRREYSNLPRSIRNRIKQKICLGCTSISHNGRCFEIPVPDKWRAKYWRGFLQNT